jgi:protein-disulfide isomerase
MKMRVAAALAALTLMAAALWAGDMSALHPPAGHHMALVVFEDMQCPACAALDPLLLDANQKYGIAVVRHDFVLPQHPWSKEAHIMARYFDTIKPELGEQFRQYIFKNQMQIVKPTLRDWADKFAAAHHVALPAFYDPKGELKAKVEADTLLGRNTGDGVKHTPTVWVVTDSAAVPPREVQQTSDLFNTIDLVKAQLPPEPKKSTKTAKKQ